MMPPIVPTQTLNLFSRWGPEWTFAVLVLFIFSGFLILAFKVVSNNTKALMVVSHMVGTVATTVNDHEDNTKDSRATVDRIDVTTRDTNDKVADMWRGTGS